MTPYFKKTVSGIFVLLLVLAELLSAKGEPDLSLVMLWPTSGTPTLKLTFGRFAQMGAYGGQLTFVSDVVVENLSTKPLTHGSFTVYLLDKN